MTQTYGAIRIADAWGLRAVSGLLVPLETKEAKSGLPPESRVIGEL